MRKNLLKICLLACIALFSVACSHSEKLVGNQFLIEGKLSGVDDGTVISLYKYNDYVRNSRYPMTTDTVKNGRFSFKAEAVSNPERMAIGSEDYGFPKGMILAVWVAPRTKVKIKGNGKIFPLWEVKSSVPNQKEENLYKNKSRDITAEEARILIERIDLMKKGDPLYKPSTDSLLVIGRSLWIKKMIAHVDIMEQTNISTVWLNNMALIATTLKYMVLFEETFNSILTEKAIEMYKRMVDFEQYDYLRKKAEELYSRMSENDKKTDLGVLTTVYLFPLARVSVGDNMPDADLLDVDGNTKHIADYLGKYLLLDFWSHGCVPCILALPEMREVAETYSDKLTIISISFDLDARWKEAMVKHDMPWVNIRDPKGMGGLASNYRVSAIPHYVMISPEGKIVDKWVGFKEGWIKNKMVENIK